MKCPNDGEKSSLLQLGQASLQGMSRVSLLAAFVALQFAEAVLGQSAAIGDKGVWQTYWHGIGAAQEGAFRLPRGCPIVAQALRAAKVGDFLVFSSFYEGTQTNEPPARIKSRYDDLNALLQNYACLIAHEAVLTNMESGRFVVYSAVSVVPRELITDNAKLQEKPIVMFSHLNKDGWKLLAEGMDEKLENALLRQADPLCYRPDAFSRKAVDQMMRSSHEFQLEQMRKRGDSIVAITSMREVFQVLEQGAVVNSWETWTNHYKAQILDPPVVFDIRDETPIDFSSPLSACRSYHRAAFLRDTQTLTNNSDQYAGAELQKWHAREKAWLKSMRTNGSVVSQSRITMLLTATTSLEGKDYVLVLWRTQDADAPTTKRIDLEKACFVFDARKKSYLLTQDLSHGSVFDSLFGLVGTSGVGFSTYDRFYETMKRSRFPKHFYKVE